MKNDDPLGIDVRQRAQKDGINNAENCGIRTNTQGKRQNRDRSHGRCLRQRAECVPHVLNCASHTRLQRAQLVSSHVPRKARRFSRFGLSHARSWDCRSHWRTTS